MKIYKTRALVSTLTIGLESVPLIQQRSRSKEKHKRLRDCLIIGRREERSQKQF